MGEATRMQPPKQYLRDRLLERQRQLRGRSARQIALRVEQDAGRKLVGASRISEILRMGLSKHISEDVMLGLSIGFELPLEEVRERAAAEIARLTPHETLPGEADLETLLGLARERLSPVEFRRWLRALLDFGEGNIRLYRHEHDDG